MTPEQLVARIQEYMDQACTHHIWGTKDIVIPSDGQIRELFKSRGYDNEIIEQIIALAYWRKIDFLVEHAIDRKAIQPAIDLIDRMGEILGPSWNKHDQAT